MNPSDEFARTEALAATWTVETADLSARIADAIGEAPIQNPSTHEALVTELRALREDIALLRGTAALLTEEMAQLRRDLPTRSVIRIAPYASSESLVRLS